MKFNLRESMFRIWYWYVNKIDKNADILFMNFGYYDKDMELQLSENNELNRYSIQLYHHLASEVEITNKDIVEIGCGRGGGLSYITNNFSPASSKGIDLDKLAVSFCNSHYTSENLSFTQGDALNLKLEDNSCDVLINVESSHRYSDMEAFLREVYRILRPDGYFLFTDFRYHNEFEEMKKKLDISGMKVLKERRINEEVIAALELDDERKRKLVEKLVPKYLRKIALNFGGTIGSETFNNFTTGRYDYFSYVLKKL